MLIFKDPWYWWTRFFLKLFFRTFYRLRVVGTDSIYKGRALLAPNHTSYYDPPLLSVVWPEPIHFLAEEPLFHRKFLGFMIKRLHAHPVQGSGKDAAIFKLLEKLLEKGYKIVIFPEGERSRNGRLLPLKPGLALLALRTQTPIIPIYIHGLFEAWPATKRWPRFGQTITCVFGNPIFVTDYLKLKKKEAIHALMLAIQKDMEHLRDWFETQSNNY